MRRCVTIFATIVLLAVSATGRTQTVKSIVSQVGLDQRLDAQVPLDITLRDEQGRTVRLVDYFQQRPVILTLVYYRCPMLCNQVLNGLLKTSQAVPMQMGEDYQVVSVSIDPKETPDMAADKKR